MLFGAVDESAFEKIAGSTTSKEVWDTLEKAFKGADRVKQVRLQTLRGEMERMKMKEPEAHAFVPLPGNPGNTAPAPMTKSSTTNGHPSPSRSRLLPVMFAAA